MVRRFLYLAAMLSGAATTSGQLLNDFRPSPVKSSYGKATQVEFSTGLVELESGVLAHHLPQTMRDFRFEERVWIIGYKTEIRDASGKTPRENYLCHTFFGDQRVDQRQDQELKGIYSDSFTPEVHLPDGFGIPLAPEERLHWMPMFNNREENPARVEMRVVVTVIREKDLTKSLKPLYASLRSVQVPHLFFVPPGHNERQVTFEMPFDGAIHFLGTHLHPYGESIEFYNVSRSQKVWKGTRMSVPDGPMQTYTNSEGYAVRAGETYRITAVYENPTSSEIDAMAGLFMLYSRR